MVTLLKVFTDRTREEVADSSAGWRRSRSAAAQRTLAADVTTLVHGPAATAAVQAASEALFGKGDLRALDAATLRDADRRAARGEVAVGTSLVDALVAVGASWSRATPPAG